MTTVQDRARRGIAHAASGRRRVAGALALVGVAVASYLALVQLGVVAQPWDPFFGPASSQAVLTSSISRALPIPDAALGAAAYLVEAVLALAGTTTRFARSNAVVGACALVAFGLLVAAVALVAIQAFVVHAYCTLCLASAAISLVIAAITIPDAVRAIAPGRGAPPGRVPPASDQQLPTTRRSHP